MLALSPSRFMTNQNPNRSVTDGQTDRQTDTLKVYGLVPLPKAGNPGLRNGF